MTILIGIIGIAAALAFLRLGVSKGLWLIHMKMEKFNLFWQDYTSMLIWFLLAVATAGVTTWFVIR